MAGFFLPGDSLLVTAGLLASQGYFRVEVLLLELCAAAILGDTVGYAIGRRIGPALFTREDSLLFKKSYLQKAHRFYEKYGAKTIVIARFVPIVRTFAPALAGVAEMNYSRFLSYNVLGGIGWVVLTIMGGYWLGRVIPNVDHHMHRRSHSDRDFSLNPSRLAYEWWKERLKQPAHLKRSASRRWPLPAFLSGVVLLSQACISTSLSRS